MVDFGQAAAEVISSRQRKASSVKLQILQQQASPYPSWSCSNDQGAATKLTYIEDYADKTEADLRSYAKVNADSATNLSASVDGRPIHNVEKYRICTQGTTCSPLQSPLFTYTLAPHDNPWAAVGEGLYVTGPPMQA